MSPTLSADLSTLFDVGGIIGAIAAGVISDYTGMSATTCVGMLAIAAPMVFILYTTLITSIINFVVVGVVLDVHLSTFQCG